MRGAKGRYLLIVRCPADVLVQFEKRPTSDVPSTVTNRHAVAHLFHLPPFLISLQRIPLLLFAVASFKISYAHLLKLGPGN